MGWLQTLERHMCSFPATISATRIDIYGRRKTSGIKYGNEWFDIGWRCDECGATYGVKFLITMHTKAVDGSEAVLCTPTHGEADATVEKKFREIEYDWNHAYATYTHLFGGDNIEIDTQRVGIAPPPEYTYPHIHRVSNEKWEQTLQKKVEPRRIDPYTLLTLEKLKYGTQTLTLKPAKPNPISEVATKKRRWWKR